VTSSTLNGWHPDTSDPPLGTPSALGERAALALATLSFFRGGPSRTRPLVPFL